MGDTMVRKIIGTGKWQNQAGSEMEEQIDPGMTHEIGLPHRTYATCEEKKVRVKSGDRRTDRTAVK
jgi:hypothetical protein